MNTSNNRDIIGLVRVHYNQCDSTQSRLRALLAKNKPKEGLVVSADYQSAGRGQHGSYWYSGKGLNIALSMYLCPVQLKVDQQFLINIWASLALVKALETYISEESIAIKWPNDILINDKKIAGIIVQSSVQAKNIHHIILGIGLNVNENMNAYNFNATSLKSETGEHICLSSIKESVIENIQKTYLKGIQLPDIGIHAKAYEQRLWRKGEKVNYLEKGEQFSGTIKGINEIGQLQIFEEKGTIRSINTKEVEFILNDE